MERLHFGIGSRYSALEATHHLARYRFVKDMCRRARVLDASCGEGYGTFLMSEWGAKSVDGIDISASAIESARTAFPRSNVRYINGNCETLLNYVMRGSYDLVVSFETMEHVDNVDAYLNSLRDTTAETGSVVISCPNDYWMYKYGGENAFHRRKFTLAEFKEATERVLGPAASWYRGTLAIGYSIFPQKDPIPVGGAASCQDLMLSYEEIDAPIRVPMQVESAPTDEELAFYVGIWGPAEPPKSLFSVYPVSMELGRHRLFPARGVWAIKPSPNAADEEAIALQKRISILEGELAREARAEAGRQQAIDAARTELARVMQERDALSDTLRTEKERSQAAVDELETQQQKARSALLGAQALVAENDLLCRRIEQLQAELIRVQEELNRARDELARKSDELHQLVTNLPWRVIGTWRKVRKVVPFFILRALAPIWDQKSGRRA